MVIRKYEPRDLEDVIILNRVCYLYPCPDEELRGKIDSGNCWVLQDDCVVGAIIVCPELDKTLIWSLMVAPAYSNQGWGNKFLATVEEFYAGQTIWLHSEQSGPANHLYTKRGYRASQILKGYYGIRDGVEMYKAV